MHAYVYTYIVHAQYTVMYILATAWLKGYQNIFNFDALADFLEILTIQISNFCFGNKKIVLKI